MSVGLVCAAAALGAVLFVGTARAAAMLDEFGFTVPTDPAERVAPELSLNWPFRANETVEVWAAYGDGDPLHTGINEAEARNARYALELVLPNFVAFGRFEPVFPVLPGKVVLAGWSGQFPELGLRVVVEHSQEAMTPGITGDTKYYSVYGRLQRIYVNENDQVTRVSGQSNELGELGGSGDLKLDATSPRLHFAMYKGGEIDRRLDEVVGGVAVVPEPMGFSRGLARGRTYVVAGESCLDEGVKCEFGECDNMELASYVMDNDDHTAGQPAPFASRVCVCRVGYMGDGCTNENLAVLIMNELRADCGDKIRDDGEECDMGSGCSEDCTCSALYKEGDSRHCDFNWGIVGGVVGGIAGLVVICCIVCVVCGLRKRDGDDRKPAPGGGGGGWPAYNPNANQGGYNPNPYPAVEGGAGMFDSFGGPSSGTVYTGATAYPTNVGTDYTTALALSAPPAPSGAAAAMQHGEHNIDIIDIQLDKEVGRGAYGVVFLGKVRGEKVAIKQLDVKGGVSNAEYEDQLREFQAEAQFMKDLPFHPNVVALKGVTPPPNFWIVTEFLAGGSLYSLLHGNDPMDDRTRVRIVRGIASGMAHLHTHNIIHRDLAARNILLDGEFTSKISDFGLSRFAEDDENKTKSDVGPIKWMSPEAIKDKVYSQKSDVWSFGVTLWEVLTRQNPYPAQDLITVATKVCYNGLRPTYDGNNDRYDFLYISLLDMCFKRKAVERPTMAEMVGHIDSATGGQM